jgi:hypothetical protein
MATSRSLVDGLGLGRLQAIEHRPQITSRELPTFVGTLSEGKRDLQR